MSRASTKQQRSSWFAQSAEYELQPMPLKFGLAQQQIPIVRRVAALEHIVFRRGRIQIHVHLTALRLNALKKTAAHRLQALRMGGVSSK
jgi:hypothetical protein